MSKFCYRIANRLRTFGKDSRGMEVMQSVLIVAVAALMLIGINGYFNNGFKDQMIQTIERVLGSDSEANADWNG